MCRVYFWLPNKAVMFHRYRAVQHQTYQVAKNYFTNNPEQLIALEQYLTEKIFQLLTTAKEEIARDYNEASFLFPFWQNYPPEERGRQPRGDQFPWIEVGEHAIGAKIARLLGTQFEIRDTGIPAGPDQRFVLTSPEIHQLTNGYTSSVWLFIDIKSVGPRDNFDHAVMSHNQISGDGVWDSFEEGVKNSVLIAQGARTSHDFHCSIPPIYILSDNTIAPVINVLIKPIYRMSSLHEQGETGQPLSSITLACTPNGILLKHGPLYLSQFPGLFYPGKDDKSKNPLKVRARVDFKLLRKIASWRVQSILATV